MVPTQIILKQKGGISWPVKLEKIDKDLYFTDGWETLVTNLYEHDFLVFKYVGNSLFHFKIFSKNGCKKQRMEALDTTLGNVKIEEEYEEEEQHTCRSTSHAYKLNISEIGLNQREKSGFFFKYMNCLILCTNSF